MVRGRQMRPRMLHMRRLIELLREGRLREEWSDGHRLHVRLIGRRGGLHVVGGGLRVHGGGWWRRSGRRRQIGRRIRWQKEGHRRAQLLWRMAGGGGRHARRYVHELAGKVNGTRRQEKVGRHLGVGRHAGRRLRLGGVRRWRGRSADSHDFGTGFVVGTRNRGDVLQFVDYGCDGFAHFGRGIGHLGWTVAIVRSRVRHSVAVFVVRRGWRMRRSRPEYVCGCNVADVVLRRDGMIYHIVFNTIDSSILGVVVDGWRWRCDGNRPTSRCYTSDCGGARRCCCQHVGTLAFDAVIADVGDCLFGGHIVLTRSRWGGAGRFNGFRVGFGRATRWYRCVVGYTVTWYEFFWVNVEITVLFVFQLINGQGNSHTLSFDRQILRGHFFTLESDVELMFFQCTNR